MKTLTGTRKVSRFVFKLTLDWAANDEQDSDTLLFDNIEDAVNEFDAQLKKIKTDKSSWEYAALQDAVDEQNCDEELDPQYLMGEYDYMNNFTQDINYFISNNNFLLKSFVLYNNFNDCIEHTYLTLRAIGVLKH